MDLLKLLSAPEFIAQIISFIILLFILRVFAWKKFLGILDERRDRISAEFDKIEGAKIETEALRREYEERLRKIEEVARQRIEEAVNSGKELAEEIKEEARRRAETLLEKGAENIKAELSKAREQFKKEAVDLTLSMAEHIIQERLTAEGDKRLVEDFLKKLDELE